MRILKELIEYIVYILYKVVSYSKLKLLAASMLSIVAFFFDTLKYEALVALFFLIVFDIITAIFACYKTGEEIQSSKIFRASVKIVIYFGLVSAGYLVEKATPIAFIDDAVIGFLALTEFISILENTGKAGFAIPNTLLNKLKKIKDK